MKGFRLLFLLLFCMSTSIFSSPDSLDTTINKLIQHHMPNADIGIVVVDIKTGRVLFERNSFQAFTPASNLKLFTAAAALFYLGPNYRYATSTNINPKALRGGILRGNLVIKFQGDPSLTRGDLKRLIAGIKKRGIKKIAGNLVIDNSHFSSPNYAPGWSIDDQHWYYSAPVTTIIVNQNSVPVLLMPNRVLGKEAHAKLLTSRLFSQVSSNVKTVTYQWSMHHCSLLLNVDKKNRIYLKGCWPIGKKTQLKIALANPTLFAEQIIRQALKKYHIVLTGRLVTGTLPKSFSVMTEHKSAPLSKLLVNMLKNSDNLYAESIIKTLGIKMYGRGSFQEGVNAVKKILHGKTNIDFRQTVIYDGSGASRYNLVTPRQVARLLYVMAHTPKLVNIFQTALPYAGQNGTLSNKMTAFDLKGHIKAKTGTMMGISALSGYMRTQDQRDIVFVILVNHIVGKVDLARNLEGGIATVLYKL